MGLTRIRAEQISDIDYKQAVRVITLTNITLSGGAPVEVDGVSLVTGDRILVAGQSNAAQNGLYQVQTLGTGENGTWIRTSDGNEDGEIQPGMVVMVTQGTQYADTPWKLTTNGEIIIGTTELTFTENYSLAFGNIFANGTAVIANVVSAGITFAAGNNVSITGNNTTKTVTISATGGGGSGTAIVNGDSNVDIATANADITMSVASVSNVVVVSTDGIVVQGNVVGNGIATTTVSATPPADPEQGDIWIDSDTAIQYIYFDDGNSSQWAEMEASVSFSSGSGAVDLSAVDQDIIPSANATYSLGNATNRWANLYLVGNTIDLGGAQIKADAASGAIALIPAPTANVANPTALVISTSGGINVVETAGGELSGNAIGNAAATASPPGAPRITQITVTDGSYDPTGATAVALAGGFVQIVGNGFQSGCQALIGSVTATATGFQSSEILDVEVPAQSAGSYFVYVVNPDGGVGLRPNGITYSGLPTWVTGSTLPNQILDVPISIQLEATSDSAVSYALAAGNSLPGNVSVSSGGLISGTVTSQAVSPTTYNFTVVATDAESQASPRSFDMQVIYVLILDYLVVAGGAAGGHGNWGAGGGGGGGGYRTSNTTFTIGTPYTVTVGAGGSGAYGDGARGSNSTFATITSSGGGGGSMAGSGLSGGSGGGGSGQPPHPNGGAGNTPSTSPPQGSPGGTGSRPSGRYQAGGGGGHGGNGGDATTSSGNGGVGTSSSISGSSLFYSAGGGGGCGADGTFGINPGTGGSSIGGNGGTGVVNGTNGTANRGAGGGGGGYQGNAGGGQQAQGSGGSGVVILKYSNAFTISNPGGGLTFTTSTAVAGYKVTTFTAGTGNIQFS